MELDKKSKELLAKIDKNSKPRDKAAVMNLGIKLYHEGTTLKEEISCYKCFLASDVYLDSLFYKGLCEYNGHGTKRDLEAAHKSFLSAAESGRKQAYAYAALTRLMLPYYDFKAGGLCKKYIQKALEEGDPYAKFPEALLKINFWGYNGKREIEEVNILIDELWEGGFYSESYFLRGLWYDWRLEDGEKEPNRVAANFYAKAVALDQRNFEAIYRLGVLVNNGGTDFDPSLASSIWALGAVAGDGYCLQHLAYAYKDDSEEYYELNLQALSYGVPGAIEAIAIVYHNGKGRARNFGKAFNLHVMACDRGDDLAAYNLGICYEKGVGCKRNVEKAKVYFRLAYDRGYASAKAKCVQYGLL